MTESSTDAVLADQLKALAMAETRLTNAHVNLTGDVAEDLEGWEFVYTAACAVNEAAEALYEQARHHMVAAEEAADDA